MREGTEHILQIMGIRITDTTEKRIEGDIALYEEYNAKKGLYVIEDSGSIKHVDEYLEKEIDENKKVIQVEILYSDTYLEMELDNAGVEDTFKEYNWMPILEKLEHHDRDKIEWKNTQRIVCDVIYHTTYDHWSGGYECEGEVIVVGYMTDKLEIVYTDSNYPVQIEKKKYHW